MNEDLLKIENMKAWYHRDKNVLDSFDLQLGKNEVVGLIGLNGAGKTTFLQILSGLLDSYSVDSIYWCGKDIKLRDKHFKMERYTVFSEDNSFQYFTFWEYLAYAFGAYKKEIPDVSALISGFHFEEYTDVLIKDLSMGNKRKVFLITAFALRLKLLLLDEPVNGLDFQSTEYLYQLIAGYKEYGTVMFSSHILESITLTSDRVLVLENGKIKQSFGQGEIDATTIREVLKIEKDE